MPDLKLIKSVRIRTNNYSISNENDRKLSIFSRGNEKLIIAYAIDNDGNEIAPYYNVNFGKSKLSDDLLLHNHVTRESFSIIQDPFDKSTPKIRSYGNQPYYLNNDSKIFIKWLDKQGNIKGGRQWSDIDGNEKKEIENENKSEYIKIATIEAPSSAGTKLIMTINSGGITKLTNDRTEYLANIEDITIINEIILRWITSVPDYEKLSLCDIKCDKIDFISPIDIREKVAETKEVVNKIKLNIVLPKDLNVRIKEDVPTIKIYVGELPKSELPYVDGFDFGDEDDFSDSLLGEEYRESDFSGDEEAPTNLKEVPPEQNYIEDKSDFESTYAEFVNYVPGTIVKLPKGYSHTRQEGYNILNSKWIGDLVTSAKSHVGSPTFDIEGTNGGGLGCASAVSIIFYRAFGVSMRNGKAVVDKPKDLSKFGSKGTSELASWFNNRSLYRKIPWRKAQPGDIINTVRGAGGAGHIGIVIDTRSDNGSYKIVSNSSSGFIGVGDGAKGTVKMNYDIKRWESVAKRNPTDTWAYRYIGQRLNTPYDTSKDVLANNIKESSKIASKTASKPIKPTSFNLFG